MGPKMLIILGVMYFVFSCEVRRTPIDLIERESELVSGFNTEFSGREFVRFFLGEYLRIIILLVIIVSSEIYMFLILYRIVIWVRRSYPRKKIYGDCYFYVEICGVICYVSVFGVMLWRVIIIVLLLIGGFIKIRT